MITIKMFIYESLKDNEKEAIDKEIAFRLKKMIIKNGGFNYSDRNFYDCVYGIIVHNKVVRRFLGDNTQTFFSEKEFMVKQRAIDIAQKLELNRPSRELLYRYINMCETLEQEPFLDFLFNADIGASLVIAYEEYLNEKSEKNMLKIVDTIVNFSYNKSSNIRYFKGLAKSFYPVYQN